MLIRVVVVVLVISDVVELFLLLLFPVHKTTTISATIFGPLVEPAEVTITITFNAFKQRWEEHGRALL